MPKEGERCECNGCDCHCFQDMSGTDCPADAGISILDQSKLFRIPIYKMAFENLLNMINDLISL